MSVMPAVSAHAYQAARRAVHTRIRILLVEDCKSDVYIVEKMLRNASPEEEFAITGVPRLADAFKVLESEPFDLIMLDLNLLDMDGVASVAALTTERPDIPLIVYSGSDDAKTREDALLCGARHYLVKGHESGYSLRFVIKNALTGRKG